MSVNEGKGSTPPSSPATTRILKLEQFVRMFKDNVLDKQDIRYCFILGSGASITSGVPSGAKLVDWWLTDMYRDSQPGASEDKLRAWVEQGFADIPGFTWDDRASFYGHIYNRRFPDNASGQTWLRKLMENKHPSFGYTVLARILSQTQHNLVVTTNFDNLVHDALIALSCPNPFLAHSHEDARFLANHDRKPRILKLHGDIDRETYNAASLIADLHEDWREPLRHLLGSYTPVFLGYGGCDPGFMKFLIEGITAGDARPRPIWAYRVDAEALKKTTGLVTDPPGRLITSFCGEFMERQCAWWLPTPGFDELMLLLGHALGYPHGRKEILAAAERGVNAYQTSLTDALKAARSHDGSRWCAPLDEMTRQAEQALLGEVKRRRWSEWREYINAAIGPTEEISRCEEASAELPDDPRPQARLALALCNADPSDPGVAVAFDTARHKLEGKYAPDSPEALYVRNSLAKALDAKGKYAAAEAEQRAVLAIRQHVQGPEHPETLASRNNLANALRAQRKHVEAEAEHRAVLAIREPVLGLEHPDTLSSRNNLAAALQSQGKYAEAEAEHRAVLAIRERVLGPEHPNTMTSRNNMATALQLQGKYAEAEAEHRAVLAIMERVPGSEHPDVFLSCYNLALCLEAQGKKPEALVLARRALAGWQKTLGEAHPDTKDAKKLVVRLEQQQ
jgi:tetratricopeptide (TPR) repeat protein